MEMSGNVFLILLIASYGSAQSLLYSSPMRSNQGFQRQSLEDYYDPSLRFPKRQHLYGNEVDDRWLINDNDEDNMENENEYVYGTERHTKHDDSGSRPMIKRNNGFGRGRRYKSGLQPPPLELFVRPQDPRRPTFDIMDATYDVPQVECPNAGNGLPRFACPSADRMGRYRCITDHHLCDGFIDCPLAEDEDRQACMFYKMTRAQINFLADAVLRWARNRK